MIDRVKIKNYRSLADVDVHLGKLTVLIGRNGAGKNTFIDVLRFVRDALRFNLETAIDSRGGIATLCRWIPTGRPFDIEVEIALKEEENFAIHAFTLARSPGAGFKVKREAAVAIYRDKLDIAPDENSTRLVSNRIEVLNGKLRLALPRMDFVAEERAPSFDDQQSLQLTAQSSIYFGLSQLRQSLVRSSFYTIFPNTLRLPQKPSSETVLNDNGENLGSALKHILTQDVWKADLILAMRKLVGDVIDIRVRSIGGYLVTELKHQSNGKRDKWFELAQESDGTLRMLGLLVALYQDPPPALIAIEEPELTIHPGALAVLSDVLREASERAQIIITTQSPDLVSYFKADEIQVVERVDGATEIGPVDDVQRAAISDHLFTGGELLRMEGLKRAVVAGGEGA